MGCVRHMHGVCRGRARNTSTRTAHPLTSTCAMFPTRNLALNNNLLTTVAGFVFPPSLT